jgi:hypothetical protein
VSSPAHAAGECPTDDQCVVVTIKGPTPSITAYPYGVLEGQADLFGAATEYRIRSAAGQAPHDGRIDEGLSLNKLLTNVVNLQPGDVQRLNLDVPNKTGGARSTSLSTAQLGPPGTTDYENDLVPALTFQNGQIGYIRPLVDGDADDVNNTVDNWLSPKSEPVHLTIWTTEERISGHVVASRTSAHPKDPIKFSVAFDGDPDVSDLTYQWYFCDGDRTNATVASPTKSWETAYKNCTVTVAISGVGVIGDIERATIQITAAPKPTSGPTGSTDGGTSHSPKTPDSGPSKGPTQSSGLTLFPGPTLPRAALPPAPAPVLTPPLIVGQPFATSEVSQVAGVFLEAGTGEVPPDSTAEVPPTTAQEQAVARKTRTATSYAWLAYLIAPALVGLGVLVELRPRRRRAS